MSERASAVVPGIRRAGGVRGGDPAAKVFRAGRSLKKRKKVQFRARGTLPGQAETSPGDRTKANMRMVAGPGAGRRVQVRTGVAVGDGGLLSGSVGTVFGGRGVLAGCVRAGVGGLRMSWRGARDCFGGCGASPGCVGGLGGVDRVVEQRAGTALARRLPGPRAVPTLNRKAHGTPGPSRARASNRLSMKDMVKVQHGDLTVAVEVAGIRYFCQAV